MGDKAYIPISDTTEVNMLIDRAINEIPRYEDSGVKYQGKYKVEKGMNTYETKRQQTRFYGLNPNTLGYTNYTRENKDTTVFYCTKAYIITYGKSVTGRTTYEVLYDYKNGVREARVPIWYPLGTDTKILDFSDCPRMFEGDFSVYQPTAAAGEWTIIVLFGWEEQK